MELFNAAKIAETMAYLGMVSGLGRSGLEARQPFGAANKAILIERLRQARKSCKALGMRVAVENCSDVIKLMTKYDFPNRQVAHECKGLLETIRRELEATVFYRMTSEELNYLEGAERFGRNVARYFPKALDEIEEAAKCLAFGRHTACVFHLMRVLEVAIKAVWKTLSLPAPKLAESWGALIGPMDKELSFPKNTRNPLWVKEEAFFAEAVADFRAVKKAWRDDTMHFTRSYNREQALEIFAASAGLMKHLASRLDQNGVMR